MITSGFGRGADHWGSLLFWSVKSGLAVGFKVKFDCCGEISKEERLGNQTKLFFSLLTLNLDFSWGGQVRGQHSSICILSPVNAMDLAASSVIKQDYCCLPQDRHQCVSSWVHLRNNFHVFPPSFYCLWSIRPPSCTFRLFQPPLVSMLLSNPCLSQLPEWHI